MECYLWGIIPCWASSDVKYRATAMSVQATKEAALYFDNVIPFLVGAEAVSDLTSLRRRDLRKLDDATTKLVVELLPESLRGSKKFAAAWSDLEKVGVIARFKPILDQYGIDDALGYLSPAEYRDLVATFGRRFAPLASRFDLYGLPVVTPNRIIGEASPGDDVLLAIRGLNLVDASKASWDQVLAFRKDADARARLRRLRLFAIENYQNRSRAFIEDDLLSRIDAYDEQVRRWGFVTRHSVLGMLLSSKALGAAMGGTLLSAFVGAPALAALSAVGGIAIEVGQVALEISKRRFELRSALRDSPISYVAEAKARLSARRE